MLSNRILDIIRKLNGGNIIKNISDKESQINLYKDGLWMYVDSDGKNYLFAEYSPDKNTFIEIEKLIYKNENLRLSLNPSDSYLVLFQIVHSIDESLYSSIIKVEENEFFFKKYIFYYTEKEYSDFIDWSKDFPNNGDYLQTLLNALSGPADFSGEDYFEFFIRLLIKIPVLNPVFPKTEMVDFEKLIEEKLEGIKKEKDELLNLNAELSKILTIYNNDIEEIVESIYTNFMVKK